MLDRRQRLLMIVPYEMPSAKDQVDAARTSILALPAGQVATLVVTGKDRISWLNGLVTCDLNKWPAGEGRYGLAVTRSGRVLADLILVADDDRVVVIAGADRVDTLREHLDHYLVMEDAEMAPETNAFEAWTLDGARANDVLAAARAAGAVVATYDRTGLGGGVVLAPVDRAAAVRSAIEEAVRRVSGAMGDAVGWEALRLERGVPAFGVDFDEKTYPQEASIEKAAVSFDKGCYLGQEVVCMLELRGHVKRKLVSVVLDGTVTPASGAAVADESGAAVGAITSAAHSPTLGVPVALAMIKRAQAVAGTLVMVDGARAKVVDRPA
jgi:folate-binding protein YgfZ